MSQPLNEQPTKDSNAKWSIDPYKDKLIRGLYIILFFIIGYILCFVIPVITIFQFIYGLITNAPNATVLKFSQGLSSYFYQIVQFLTYTSDLKPYPFSSWPGEK